MNHADLSFPSKKAKAFLQGHWGLVILGSTEIKMHQRGLSLSLEGALTMEYGERSEMRCGDYLSIRIRIRICNFISIDVH